jgi:hypothetical protein
MNLEKLRKVIADCGGGINPQEYAVDLHQKIERIQQIGLYSSLIKQLGTANEKGHFRGHVFEINFINQFLLKGHRLRYEVKQEMKANIDFCWNIAGKEIYLEAKTLGQYQPFTDFINKQIALNGIAHYSLGARRDIIRLQRDIITKAFGEVTKEGKVKSRKFNPKPLADWINLVCVDVSELQGGTIDVGDCRDAVGGGVDNLKSVGIVGVFDDLSGVDNCIGCQNWIAKIHNIPNKMVHPREYIHGVLFLFRMPKETAALSYDLKGTIVWNQMLINQDAMQQISFEMANIIPEYQVAS